MTPYGRLSIVKEGEEDMVANIGSSFELIREQGMLLAASLEGSEVWYAW